MNTVADVFISYAKEDQAVARRLSSDLQARKVSTWLDEERLLPGQNWQDEVVKAIEGCRTFLPLISTKSVNKTGHVQKELRTAFDVWERLPPGSNFLIPARVDDVQPRHPQLRELHWVDLFSEWELSVQKIAAVIRSLRSNEDDHANFRAYFHLRATPSADLTQMTRECRRLPGIVHAAISLGGPDIVVTVDGGSLEEISSISELIHRIPGVESSSMTTTIPDCDLPLPAFGSEVENGLA